MNIIVIIPFIKDFSEETLNAPTRSECNSCHGPSHKGYVSYTVTLSISEMLLNGTPSELKVSVINSQFPLSSTSITIEETTEYSLAPNQLKTASLGNIGRGGSTSSTFSIIPHVTTNKTITLIATFSGSANDHKRHTYQEQFGKDVFISIIPAPLLYVVSTPPSDTTLIKGSINDTGLLEIRNVGILPLENVQIETTGILNIDDVSSFSIPLIDPGEKFTYNILIDTSKVGKGTISIIYIGNSTQKAIITVTIQNLPPTPLPLTFGRVLGYVTVILLFSSVFAGVGHYHLKKRFSGRKIRILHADLSNVSFTMVVIHAMVLTIPESPWAESYTWFELLPEQIPSNIQTLGLELGRLSFLLMYVSIITGFFIAKIIKQFGRKIGISIHMLAYISLIGGITHAILIGGTAGNPFVALLLILAILSIIWLKLDIKRKIGQRKAERALKRLEREQIKVKKEKIDLQEDSFVLQKLTKEEITQIDKLEDRSALKIVSTLKDSLSKEKDLIGVICWKCNTLNDDDANFCKRCASLLEGLLCQSCFYRNDNKSTLCKNCNIKIEL